MKGYRILMSCCFLASLCLASPIAPVKSVEDSDESPDQVSQSLNMTLDSTEEVGLITSETVPESETAVLSRQRRKVKDRKGRGKKKNRKRGKKRKEDRESKRRNRLAEREAGRRHKKRSKDSPSSRFRQFRRFGRIKKLTADPKAERLRRKVTSAPVAPLSHNSINCFGDPSELTGLTGTSISCRFRNSLRSLY